MKGSVLASGSVEFGALVVMPDHFHAVVRVGESQWREIGKRFCARSVWRHFSGPFGAEPIPDRKHLLRTIRYVALNPCRARLAADPLAWTFSSYRDLAGVAADPLVTIQSLNQACGLSDSTWTASRWHRYVSSDPSSHVDGTPGLSHFDHGAARFDAQSGDLGAVGPTESLRRIESAVVEVFRLPQPLAALSRRHPARRSFVAACLRLGWGRSSAPAAILGIRRSAYARLKSEISALDHSHGGAMDKRPVERPGDGQERWLSRVLRVIADDRLVANSAEMSEFEATSGGARAEFGRYRRIRAENGAGYKNV